MTQGKRSANASQLQLATLLGDGNGTVERIERLQSLFKMGQYGHVGGTPVSLIPPYPMSPTISPSHLINADGFKIEVIFIGLLMQLKSDQWDLHIEFSVWVRNACIYRVLPVHPHLPKAPQSYTFLEPRNWRTIQIHWFSLHDVCSSRSIIQFIFEEILQVVVAFEPETQQWGQACAVENVNGYA